MQINKKVILTGFNIIKPVHFVEKQLFQTHQNSHLVSCFSTTCKGFHNFVKEKTEQKSPDFRQILHNKMHIRQHQISVPATSANNNMKYCQFTIAESVFFNQSPNLNTSFNGRKPADLTVNIPINPSFDKLSKTFRRVKGRCGM